MTRLRIEHRTEYRYSRPVQFGPHRLVLRPREGHDLRVESMRLEIAPTPRLQWSRDIFGNCVAHLDFEEPTENLKIVNHLIVERTPPLQLEQTREVRKVDYPVVYDPLETSMSNAYLAPSYPGDTSELREWLNGVGERLFFDDAERTVFALCSEIHRQTAYRRRDEKGVQTPAQTLQLRTGSCRDMATLAMEAGRLLGVAMRFASGYLDCASSIAGRAATHAWVEAYLPTLGWRGFDPTLGESTSLKHILIGVSSHPRGVMPITGRFIGCQSDYRGMTVQVTTELLPCTFSVTDGADVIATDAY